MADTNPFKSALEEARKALGDAIEEREAIERRIVSLKQTIEGLTALCEPESEEDVVDLKREDGFYMPGISLTDAIRRVFSEAKNEILRPPEVRNALLAMGVDLAKYKQPLVPIHNTLNRLESQGEIVTYRDLQGSVKGYRWVSPFARAVAEVETKPRTTTIAKMLEKYRMEPPPIPPAGGVPNPLGKTLGEMLRKEGAVLRKDRK